MTDAELIARLRDEHVAASRTEAADRIEALSISNATLIADRIEELEAKLAIAVEALERIAGVKGPYNHPFPETYEGYGAFAIVTSRTTLAEIKGESDAKSNL